MLSMVACWWFQLVFSFKAAGCVPTRQADALQNAEKILKEQTAAEQARQILWGLILDITGE